jgi:hypothetical protein
MSNEHADPPLTVRPPLPVLEAAKDALESRGLDMRGFVVASLDELADETDQVLARLAHRWPPPKPRGQPRPPAGVIYAFRTADDPSTWYGPLDALPAGEFETGTLDFQPVAPNRFTGQLEVRYGPVDDDVLPSFYAFTTVDGKRVRPTTEVHGLLFGAD